MIVIDHVILSDDIADNYFVCDLLKCKGACCVEGDLGAPLTPEEAGKLVEIYPVIEPYLTEKGKAAIQREGYYIHDQEGDLSTTTVYGKECAYAYYDEKGIVKCGIEKAWKDGKTDFRKPISCHLYPARVTQYDQYEAVNYDRWHICNPACHNGKALQVPIYKFLKESLIRKYGEAWYAKLEKEIESREVEYTGTRGQG